MSDQMFCPHCNPCMGNGNEKCRRPAAAPAAPAPECDCPVRDGAMLHHSPSCATKAAPAPVKAYGDCRKNGYELGELCDDAADCARNGCAKTRQAFGCIQELQGSAKCLVSCGSGLCAATRAPVAAPAPDADGHRTSPRAVKWLTSELRVTHCSNEGLHDSAAALIEQQARELAQVMRERNDANRACLEELTRADRAERDLAESQNMLEHAHDQRDANLLRATNAERDLAAARAAIAAADAMRRGEDCPMCDNGKLRNPNKEHWDSCTFANFDAARARVTL